MGLPYSPFFYVMDGLMPDQPAEQVPYLRTPLRPHQQRTVNKLMNNDVLVVHGMGSGKTLTSIGALAAIGKPGFVLTPAPLVGNFHKELAKHVEGTLPTTVMSINTASGQNAPIPEGATVIVDEAQTARNASSIKSKYLTDQTQRAGRIALLTGTPVYNQVSDIAPLLNIIHRNKVLPTNPSDFNREFVQDEFVDPSWWGALRGVKPGVLKKLVNQDKLRGLLKGHVDYYANRDGYPTVKTEDVDVPFGDRQEQVYQMVAGKAPYWMQYKLKNNLPPAKQEAGQLNSFLAGVRQASLSIAPYDRTVSPLEAVAMSPKLQRAVDDIKAGLANNPDFKAMTYSNYLQAALHPMSAALTKEGIPHALFHGQLNRAARDQIVNDFNSGRIKVLLGSSSAAEGLDLKGTRMVQVLEPHFNNSKIQQVIGRAARFGSHAALPEDQRNVTVRNYRSTVKPGWLGRLLGDKETRADEYIQARANDKDLLFNQMQKLWQEEGVKEATEKQALNAIAKRIMTGTVAPATVGRLRARGSLRSVQQYANGIITGNINKAKALGIPNAERLRTDTPLSFDHMTNTLLFHGDPKLKSTGIAPADLGGVHDSFMTSTGHIDNTAVRALVGRHEVDEAAAVARMYQHIPPTTSTLTGENKAFLAAEGPIFSHISPTVLMNEAHNAQFLGHSALTGVRSLRNGTTRNFNGEGAKRMVGDTGQYAGNIHMPESKFMLDHHPKYPANIYQEPLTPIQTTVTSDLSPEEIAAIFGK